MKRDGLGIEAEVLDQKGNDAGTKRGLPPCCESRGLHWQHDEDTGHAITPLVTLAGTNDGEEEAQVALRQDLEPPATRHRRARKPSNVTTPRDQDLISKLEGKIKERQDEE